MAIPKPKGEKYSYADYLTWDDAKRWEIIDGFAYNMTQAPNRKHQSIAGNLFREFSFFLKNKRCKAYMAPFDVRLAEKEASEELVFTVVQPDISIFCDLSKLDARGAIGAPDLIVEILSESTTHKDLNVKLLLYQKHEVKEYWIVDPDKEMLYVYHLDNKGRYILFKEYCNEEKVQVGLFNELVIDLAEIFAE